MSAFGYRKIWRRSGLPFEFVDLVLPPLETSTFGMWSDVPLEAKLYMDAHGWDYLGGCHGAAHAVMAVLPSFILCDRADIGEVAPWSRAARGSGWLMRVHE